MVCRVVDVLSQLGCKDVEQDASEGGCPSEHGDDVQGRVGHREEVRPSPVSPLGCLLGGVAYSIGITVHFQGGRFLEGILETFCGIEYQ